MLKAWKDFESKYRFYQIRDYKTNTYIYNLKSNATHKSLQIITMYSIYFITESKCSKVGIWWLQMVEFCYSVTKISDMICDVTCHFC